MSKSHCKIGVDDLKNAALVCLRSATELLADAELLQLMKRYARALFLACIGIEELGKARLALELFELGEEPDPKEFHGFWRHHQSKTAVAKGLWIYNPERLQELAPDLCPAGYENWEDFCEKDRRFLAHMSNLIASIKMQSLYVDIVENERIKYTLPSRSVKSQHSEGFIKELREGINKLSPSIRKLGHLNIPAYETGEMYDPGDL